VRLITNLSGTWRFNRLHFQGRNSSCCHHLARLWKRVLRRKPDLHLDARLNRDGLLPVDWLDGAGSNNIYNSKPKTGSSYTFTAMPTNGETIYVRLITNYSGTWVYNDYVYTAAGM